MNNYRDMEYKDFDRFKEGIKYISEGIKNKTNEDYFYGLLKRNNKKVNDVIEFDYSGAL